MSQSSFIGIGVELGNKREGQKQRQGSVGYSFKKFLWEEKKRVKQLEEY